MAKIRHLLREILLGWWLVIINAILLVYSALTMVRDAFPTEIQNKYQLHLFFPHWPWQAWVAIFAVSNFLIVLGGAYAAVERREKEKETLATKLKEIEDAKPRIIVRDVYTEKVPVNQNGLQVCVANVLRAKLENAPPHHYPNSEAKNVTAKISFYDHSGQLLIEDMDARWTASTQPLGPHWQSIVPLLGMDFGIGDKRDLDIAFAETTYIKMPPPSLVALNNDNFRFPRWREQEHVLSGERFLAEIHVRAVWVDTKFSVEFWPLSHGEIGFALVKQQ
jgi:hypothetical protein